MIKYKIRSVVAGMNNHRSKQFMAVAVRTQAVSLERIAKRIAHSSSFTEGDVYGVLRNFVEEIRFSLSEGEAVELGSIGRFSVSVNSDLVDRPEELTADRVHFKRVVYTPSTEFRQAMQREKFSCAGLAKGVKLSTRQTTVEEKENSD